MSATAGKVALVNATAALPTGGCPTANVLVLASRLGPTANCSEMIMPAPAPSNTTAVFRGGGGCTDTDNNASNFTAGRRASQL